MGHMITYDYITRAAAIAEAARRAGRSLTREERSILGAAYQKAGRMDIATRDFNSAWLDGEKNWKHYQKTRVVVKFDYYETGYEEVLPFPNYLIKESNHPAFGVGSHVSSEQLIEAGIKIPRTMSYPKWIKRGRKKEAQ